MTLVFNGDNRCRFMQKDDLQQVMEIEEKCYPFPWTKKIMQDCLQVGYICLLVEENNKIAGYIILSHGAQECHVLNLCVSPVHRGKKYGQLLLTEGLNVAQQLSVNDVYLEVRESNKFAISLYFDNGFNEIGCRNAYYPSENGREDALVMAKVLI